MTFRSKSLPQSLLIFEQAGIPMPPYLNTPNMTEFSVCMFPTKSWLRPYMSTLGPQLLQPSSGSGAQGGRGGGRTKCIFNVVVRHIYHMPLLQLNFSIRRRRRMMKTGTAPCRPGLWMSAMRPLTCAHLPLPEEWLTLPCPRSPNLSQGTSVTLGTGIGSDLGLSSAKVVLLVFI